MLRFVTTSLALRFFLLPAATKTTCRYAGKISVQHLRPGERTLFLWRRKQYFLSLNIWIFLVCAKKTFPPFLTTKNRLLACGEFSLCLCVFNIDITSDFVLLFALLLLLSASLLCRLSRIDPVFLTRLLRNCAKRRVFPVKKLFLFSAHPTTSTRPRCVSPEERSVAYSPTTVRLQWKGKPSLRLPSRPVWGRCAWKCTKSLRWPYTSCSFYSFFFPMVFII